jgi:hypothetical protein
MNNPDYKRYKNGIIYRCNHCSFENRKLVKIKEHLKEVHFVLVKTRKDKNL